MLDNQEVQKELESLVQYHKKKLFEFGRRIVPYITPEDILQPNDYPELESHPEFRYQEGVLAGINEAIIVLRAVFKN
jgi:hypothetical protein